MPRNSYCRQTKLSDIAGRIDYISNPDRQEHLYATHDTADPEFWKMLKEENHREYERYGCTGKVVEGREWVIALEESLIDEDPDVILKTFVDAFCDKYAVECIAALHHNHSESNYHIHLIQSERKRLQEPIEKRATRNMFFDEKGLHKRTKKEILDENGEIRKGCKIVPKGETYERAYVTAKDPIFKTRKHVKDVKILFTKLNNQFIKDESRKLTIFQDGSVYLATKKIGIENPKADYIKADNEARTKWNLKADEALVSGVLEEEVLKIKKSYISEPVKQSILKEGKQTGRLNEIIQSALKILSNAISSINQIKEPILTVDLEEFKEMKQIKIRLDANQSKIDKLKNKLDDLQKEYAGLFSPWKKTKNLKVQAETVNQMSGLQKEHSAIVSKAGYKNIQSFIKAYNKAVQEIKKFEVEMAAYKTVLNPEKVISQKPEHESVRKKIMEFQKEAKRQGHKEVKDRKKSMEME